MRLASRIVAVAAAGVLLAACGKRGDPIPPGPDEAVSFPRSYPREAGQGPVIEGPQTVFPPSSRGVRGTP
jgi:hypothetical protein